MTREAIIRNEIKFESFNCQMIQLVWVDLELEVIIRCNATLSDQRRVIYLLLRFEFEHFLGREGRNTVSNLHILRAHMNQLK